MKKYVLKVIQVVFFLVFLHVNVSGEQVLVCLQKERGIVGGNSSIFCHSSSAIQYLTVSKTDGHRKSTVVTVSGNGTMIFYDDSRRMSYPQRIKVSGDMKKGLITLTWVRTRPEDVGLYEILYKLLHDIVDQKSYVNKTVFVPPSITSGSGCRKLTVIEGDDGALDCNVYGSKPIAITWKKDNKTWNGKSLSLKNIRREDQGCYKMEAKNRNGNKTFTVSKCLDVQVLFKPEASGMRILPIATSEYYERGDIIQIHCIAVANPPANYTLYVDGHEFIQDNRDSSGGNRTPGIFEVKLQRNGNNTFKCVPFNKAGIGEAQLLSVFVQDHSRKDPPVKLEVVLPVVFVSVVALIAVTVGILSWTRRRRWKIIQCSNNVAN